MEPHPRIDLWTRNLLTAVPLPLDPESTRRCTARLGIVGKLLVTSACHPSQNRGWIQSWI